MKARKSDGSRWFTPTTSELMDRWLSEPQLLDWLRRTVEFQADTLVAEQQIAELALALMPRILSRYVDLKAKVLALQLRRSVPSECRSCDRYWAPWIHGPAVGEPCPACGVLVTSFSRGKSN